MKLNFNSNPSEIFSQTVNYSYNRFINDFVSVNHFHYSQTRGSSNSVTVTEAPWLGLILRLEQALFEKIRNWENYIFKMTINKLICWEKVLICQLRSVFDHFKEFQGLRSSKNSAVFQREFWVNCCYPPRVIINWLSDLKATFQMGRNNKTNIKKDFFQHQSCFFLTF